MFAHKCFAAFRSVERATRWRPMIIKAVRDTRSLIGVIVPSILTSVYNAVLYPDCPYFASLVQIESV
jgi:hypothetical protein